MSDATGYEHLFRLDGRTALVVGAGSGIGAAVAAGLAAFGATVVCADADVDAAARTATDIGGAATSRRLDLLDAGSVEAAAADLGAPDVLVTTPAVNVRKAIVDYTDADLDRVVDLNLKGTFRLCRTFGAAMAAAGRGSMIGFSSIRSQTTEPGQGAYAATKAATVMLFKTLAAELGPQGVRANTIAPGVVETPLTAPIKARPSGTTPTPRSRSSAAGRNPRRWSVRSSTLHRMRAATSPARRSSSTGAGRPPTAASSRRRDAPVKP
jgi:NAD(P)-dependent dehydrogenase (short-subunit alcohol dehydrogenase family)